MIPFLIVLLLIEFLEMNIHGKAEECSGDDDVTKNEELLASLCFASPEPIMKWFVSGIEN